MFFDDLRSNMQTFVLWSLCMLCSSCSVTSSTQSVYVKRADDSKISEALSQKIKVRVVSETDGAVIDEFTGNKTVTLNAYEGETYLIELIGSGEMSDKCHYGRSYIQPWGAWFNWVTSFSPSQSTVHDMFWYYHYPDVVLYYPEIDENDECM